MRGTRYEIASERRDMSVSSWTLVFQEVVGMWVVERHWNIFDSTLGMAVDTGTERQSIEAFEVSRTGRRFIKQLRDALDKAKRDA